MRCLGALLLVAVLAACGDGSGSTADARPAATDAWRELAPSRLARTEVAVARVGRAIYVAGGFERRSGEVTAAVERYDIRRDRWTRVADLPDAVHHAAAVAHGGRLYVLGGYRGGGSLTGPTAALLRYHPGNDRWRRLPSMPAPRGALAAGVLRGRIHAVGGVRSGDSAVATHEVYDIERRRWQAAPPMDVAREHLAATVSGGRLYVLAGRAAGAGNFAVAEAYDPRTREWERLPDMRKPRGGIAAATLPNGRVVVVGGEEAAGTIREVEAYSPRRDRWRSLPPMRTPRHGLGAVTRGDRIYAVQGGDEPGFFFTNAIEYLDVR